MGFVANFLENTAVKKFWKSAKICRSYERMYSSTDFFDSVTMFVSNSLAPLWRFCDAYKCSVVLILAHVLTLRCCYVM